MTAQANDAFWMPANDPDGRWARAHAAAVAAREESVSGVPRDEAPVAADPDDDDEQDITGWARIDLGPHIEGAAADPEPVVLTRTDGVKLLYADKLHWFSGEPESLKSWLAQVAVAQALADGMAVAFLDFEGDAAEIVSRLRALGVGDKAILARLNYHRPEAPMTAQLVDQVVAHAAGANVALCVIDGCQAAMGASGLDSNSAKDFYQWWNRLGRRLQAVTHGPMVVIDHVVKNAENRGQYAAGTGQKLAAVDVHLGLELVRAFGRGLTGESKVILHKDRPGRLRPRASGKLLGRLVLESDAVTGSVGHVIEPAADGDGKFRPTALMERVSRYVELASGPVSQKRIRDEVVGKVKYLVEATRCLLEEGYLETTPGPIVAGNATATYASVRPYRESDDGPKTSPIQGEIEV